jgi:pectate lyase
MNRSTTPLCTLLLASSLSFGFTKTDKPEGWASQTTGTTGGTGGTEVTVSTMADLQTQAKSSGKKIILVNKGTYTGVLTLASDKTILGKEPGVTIQGSVKISGSGVSNVIVRNLAIKGDKCSSYDACKSGADAMYIGNEAHHVWLDHVDISDGQDGNCDITNGADYVTITWSKFWYSYDKEHRFSNLIAGDDNVAIDKDKLRITYAFCWWADRVVQRQPRGRAGKVHVVNNLYTSTAADYACGPGVDIQMLIENNNFKNSGYAIEPFDGTPAPAYKSTGNIGTAKDISKSSGTVFTPPYTLSEKMDASAVEGKVKPAAGNTMTLGTTSVAPATAARQAPFVAPSGSGWTLHNASALAVTFRVVGADGRSVLPRTTLEAGRNLSLPSSGNSVIVHFLGADRPADIYVPFGR